MRELEVERLKMLLHRLKDDKQELLKQELQARRDQDWDRHDLIVEVLDERHAGWDAPNPVSSSRGGTKSPIEVSFRGAVQIFDDAKQAYIWIMEKFVAAEEIHLSLSSWQEKFVNPGAARKNIARSLPELFVRSPHLRSDKNKWHQLRNGWYLNLNIKTEDKRTVLFSYAQVAGINGSEWDWKVIGEVRKSLEDLLGVSKSNEAPAL